MEQETTTMSIFRNCPRRMQVSLMMMVWALLSTTLVGHAQTTGVTVDQSPPTVSNPLPPNIVLMLDDSGSMRWNFMPDLQFLNGVSIRSTTGTVNNDALINPSNNGVYYAPDILYTPPPKSNSTPTAPVNYPDSPGLTQAWPDGFTDTSHLVDITQYANAATGANGTSQNGRNDPSFPRYKAAYDTDTSINTGNSNVAYSDVLSQVSGTQTPSCPKNSTFDPNSGKCLRSNGKDGGSPICNSGYSYNAKNKLCEQSTDYTFFQYSTGPAAGPYSVFYVAPHGQGCGAQSNCVDETTPGDGTNGAPAGVTVGQNIANWFSYYRTRDLAAKSGVLTAFNTLGPDSRLGFGSINSRNKLNLPAPVYSGATTSIAEVQLFGDGTSSSIGTQKTQFWNWVTSIVPSGGTSLQAALADVGNYYMQTQPWQTSDQDKAQLACRQAYAIMTTDGFWNGTFPSAKTSLGTTIAGAATQSGDSNGKTITGPNGQSYTYTPAPPYNGPYHDTKNATTTKTLADVATYYWKNDLQPSLNNEVPVSADDPAFWQHMTTFTLGLGFAPTGLQPMGTTVDQIQGWANDSNASIPSFSWPAPISNDISTIADLAHAGINGHGGFFSAHNPKDFANGIQDALARIQKRRGAGASLAANSTELTTDSMAFQAIYTAGSWVGDLIAYPLQVSNTNGAAVLGTIAWQASKTIQSAHYKTRNIQTCNPCGSTATAVAFEVSSLSPEQQTALTPASNNETLQEIVSYLRGDNSLEVKPGNPAGKYRPRVDSSSNTPSPVLLGDIVNSQPVYQSGSVWVASNDGMLHEFNASTGQEIYAYLPSAVILAGIKALADPAYGSGSDNQHQYFNDGELTIVVTPDNGGTTYLVGTTGRGPARAVYGFDITTPSAPKLLWEVSGGDIGQMVGKPLIVKTASDGWVALIGNGYNSSDGSAVLLQINMATGVLSSHATDGTQGNGLAAPNTWIPDIANNSPMNGVSTIAYAGDLHGNVWAFDLSAGNTAGTLVFTAKDASGNIQPITAGMLIGQDPQLNIWVFFGTGRYLAQSDLLDTNAQSWYGLIVQANSNDVTPINNRGRSALAARFITSETTANVGADGTTLAGRTITTRTGLGGASGWYIDLAYPADLLQGERMVGTNQFRGSLLLGTTLIPVATDPCHPSGAGWIMAIDPFTGTNPTSPFFDPNNDGKFDDTDESNGVPFAGIGFNAVPNEPIFVGNTMLTNFDDATTSLLNSSGVIGAFGRVSWRELINF